MDEHIDVASEELETEIMQRALSSVALKVLKGELEGWTDKDKDWLQEVAKRSVLNWDEIFLVQSKKKTTTSEITSTTKWNQDQQPGRIKKRT